MNDGGFILNYSHADWKARADALVFRQQAFIGGRFVDAASGGLRLPQKLSNSRSRKNIMFDGTARVVGDLKMPCTNAGFKRAIG